LQICRIQFNFLARIDVDQKISALIARALMA